MNGYYSGYKSKGIVLNLRVAPQEKPNTVRQTSSVQVFTGWPNSSTLGATQLTSSFGQSYSFNSELQGGVSFDGASLKGSMSTGLTYSYSSSVTSTQPNPLVSRNPIGYPIEAYSWDYRFNPLGTVTYIADTYLLFEAKNDGRINDPYSFRLDFTIKYSTCLEDFTDSEDSEGTYYWSVGIR
ncbi:MAG: hypothetical protein PUA93_03995 [Eubacteriales bacterium]|nr:hypothetical protein [Eubacteriales bacterium]